MPPLGGITASHETADMPVMSGRAVPRTRRTITAVRVTSQWVHTQRTLARTSGGKGSGTWNYGKHATVKVRNVWLRSCLWNSSGTICEGGAH
jgi:hypothetical protein